jgi:hypothetical protein
MLDSLGLSLICYRWCYVYLTGMTLFKTCGL